MSAEPTRIVYGWPPPAFDPPSDAVQTAPSIPGSAALEELAPASLDEAVILAPPGVIERRHVLAQALRSLKVGGRLDVMAPKHKGGSRLGKELKQFGLEFAETAKAHHRRCQAARPAALSGLDEAVIAGGLRRIEALDAWSQPGIFAWDRVDPGTALLIEHLPPLSGQGADLGCGWGALGRAVLASPRVEALMLVDLDRRAVEAAQRNIDDPRAVFDWADARTLPTSGGLDFVVSNPPFHDGGAEDRRLGQAFIGKAAAMLRKGGALWLVANRHLPYERSLGEAFARVRPVAERDGYKLFEATR